MWRLVNSRSVDTYHSLSNTNNRVFFSPSAVYSGVLWIETWWINFVLDRKFILLSLCKWSICFICLPTRSLFPPFWVVILLGWSIIIPMGRW
jgi:hypothetical protein